MKKTGIMTDSHSGILENEASKLGIAVLPMPFYIDEKLYREGVDISREEFYEMLRKGADVATSQPSPESVMHMWSAMLQEYEELVYIPISSGLSGSCMTAQAMAQEEPYAGRVFVVDNGRVSTPMHRSVLDAVELAEKGYRAQKIKDILEKNREHMVIYVGLSTLTYLKKGGRISAAAAFAGGVLSGIVEPVGAMLTILAAGYIVPALPYLLSFAAGAMIYVIVEELIPEMSQGEHSDLGTIFFAVRFTVMMSLDVALG